MADHHRAELVVDALDMAHGRGGLEPGCVAAGAAGPGHTPNGSAQSPNGPGNTRQDRGGSAESGLLRWVWAYLRNAAARRLRSSARVASTTWAGSTPSSGIEVRSGRRAWMLWPTKTATACPAHLAYGGCDDQAGGIADGDAAGLGRGLGARDGLSRGAQQRFGLWQEYLTRLGEAAAPRSAVQ